MVRQITTGSATLALLALTAPAGGAQDELFPETPYPMGRVVDEDGNPVRGATIRIRVDHPAGFGQVLHELLRTQPPGGVLSGRDGSYVLPLTEGQRRLAPGEARLSVVVEKAGYLPWVEHLPRGIRGYLGSRAVLRHPAPPDRLSFLLEDPAPSTVLLVERVVQSGRPHSLGHTAAIAVPEGGRVETTLSLRPDPPHFPPPDRSVFIRLQARVLYPGRSSLPQVLGTGPEVQRIDAQPVKVGRSRAVRLAGGGTPEGLKGLYRCPDGRLRWFVLPADRAPQDAALRLVAVAADGHLATLETRSPALREIPEQVGVRRIRVTHDGSPVQGVRARLLPLELWTPSTSSPIPAAGIGIRSICTLRGDDRGVLTLPESLPAEPGFLLVRAPGHRPARIIEPRGLDRNTELHMEKLRAGSLRLLLRTARGAPVPRASLLFSDTAFAALDEGLPRTDATGVFEHQLPAGKHVVGVIADGHEPVWKSLSIQAGRETEVEVEVRAGTGWRLLSVDDKGRPVPFATLEHIQTTKGTTRSQGVLATDSLGRAIVNHEGPRLSLRSAQQGWRVELENPSRIHRIRVRPTPLVMVALEPGTGILQENWLLEGAVRSRFTIRRKGGSSRILTRWVGERATAGCWIVDRGPPVRLQGEEVMAAWSGNPGQVVMVDRSEMTRRVPVRVVADDPPPVEDLRIVYRTGGRAVNLGLGLGQILEDRPGGRHLALRDDTLLPCTLLHPDYVPLDFAVAGKSGPDTPVELRLEKGVGLSFDVEFHKPPRPDSLMTLRVRDRASGTYALNTIDRLPAIAPGDLDKPFRIRSPAALPAGTYSVYFRIPGFPTLTADVDLRDGEPAVLEVGAPNDR